MSKYVSIKFNIFAVCVLLCIISSLTSARKISKIELDDNEYKLRVGKSHKHHQNELSSASTKRVEKRIEPGKSSYESVGKLSTGDNIRTFNAVDQLKSPSGDDVEEQTVQSVTPAFVETISETESESKETETQDYELTENESQASEQTERIDEPIVVVETQDVVQETTPDYLPVLPQPTFDESDDYPSLINLNGPEPNTESTIYYHGEEIEEGSYPAIPAYDQYGNPVPINYITPITINSPYPYVQTHVHIPAPEQILFSHPANNNRPARENQQRVYRNSNGNGYVTYGAPRRTIDWEHIQQLMKGVNKIQQNYRNQPGYVVPAQPRIIQNNPKYVYDVESTRGSKTSNNIQIKNTISSSDVDEIIIEEPIDNREILLNSVEKTYQEIEEPVILTKVISYEEDESSKKDISETKQEVSELLDNIQLNYPGNGLVQINIVSKEDVENKNNILLNIHGQVDHQDKVHLARERGGKYTISDKNNKDNFRRTEIIKTDKGLNGKLDIYVTGKVRTDDHISSEYGLVDSSIERGRLNMHIKGDLNEEDGEKINIDQVKHYNINYNSKEKNVKQSENYYVSKESSKESYERIHGVKNSNIKLSEGDSNLEIVSRENVYQRLKDSESGENYKSHDLKKSNIYANSKEQNIRITDSSRINYHNKLNQQHEHYSSNNRYKINENEQHQRLLINDKEHYHGSSNSNYLKQNLHENKNDVLRIDVNKDGEQRFYYKQNEHVHNDINDRKTGERIHLHSNEHELVKVDDKHEYLNYHDNSHLRVSDKGEHLNLHSNEHLNYDSNYNREHLNYHDNSHLHLSNKDGHLHENKNEHLNYDTNYYNNREHLNYYDNSRLHVSNKDEHLNVNNRKHVNYDSRDKDSKYGYINEDSKYQKENVYINTKQNQEYLNYYDNVNLHGRINNNEIKNKNILLNEHQHLSLTNGEGELVQQENLKINGKVIDNQQIITPIKQGYNYRPIIKPTNQEYNYRPALKPINQGYRKLSNNYQQQTVDRQNLYPNQWYGQRRPYYNNYNQPLVQSNQQKLINSQIIESRNQPTFIKENYEQVEKKTSTYKEVENDKKINTNQVEIQKTSSEIVGTDKKSYENSIGPIILRERVVVDKDGHQYLQESITMDSDDKNGDKPETTFIVRDNDKSDYSSNEKSSKIVIYDAFKPEEYQKSLNKPLKEIVETTEIENKKDLKESFNYDYAKKDEYNYENDKQLYNSYESVKNNDVKINSYEIQNDQAYISKANINSKANSYEKNDKVGNSEFLNEQIDYKVNSYEKNNKGGNSEYLNEQIDYKVNSYEKNNKGGNSEYLNEKADYKVNSYEKNNKGGNSEYLNEQIDYKVNSYEKNNKGGNSEYLNEKADYKVNSYEKNNKGGNSEYLNEQIDYKVNSYEKNNKGGNSEYLNEKADYKVNSYEKNNKGGNSEYLNEQIDYKVNSYEKNNKGGNSEYLNEQIDYKFNSYEKKDNGGSSEYLNLNNKEANINQNSKQILNEHIDYHSYEKSDKDRKLEYSSPKQSSNQYPSSYGRTYDKGIENGEYLRTDKQHFNNEYDKKYQEVTYQKNNEFSSLEYQNNQHYINQLPQKESSFIEKTDSQSSMYYKNPNQRIIEQSEQTESYEQNKRELENTNIENERYIVEQNPNQKISERFDTNINSYEQNNKKGSSEHVQIDSESELKYQSPNQFVNEESEIDINSNEKTNKYGSFEYSNINIKQSIDSQTPNQRISEQTELNVNSYEKEVNKPKNYVKPLSYQSQEIYLRSEEKIGKSSYENKDFKDIGQNIYLTYDNRNQQILGNIKSSFEEEQPTVITYSDGNIRITEQFDEDQNVGHIQISSVEVNDCGDEIKHQVKADIRTVPIENDNELTIIDNLQGVVYQNNEPISYTDSNNVNDKNVLVDSEIQLYKDDRPNSKILIRTDKNDKKLQPINVGCDSVEVVSNVQFSPVEERRIQSFLGDCGSDAGSMRTSLLPQPMLIGQNGIVPQAIMQKPKYVPVRTRPSQIYQLESKPRQQFLTLKSGTVNDFYNSLESTSDIKISGVVPRNIISVEQKDEPNILPTVISDPDNNELTILSPPEIGPVSELDLETLSFKKPCVEVAPSKPEIVAISPDYLESLGYEKHTPEQETKNRPQIRYIDNDRIQRRRSKQRRRQQMDHITTDQGFLPFRDGCIHRLHEQAGWESLKNNGQEFIPNDKFKEIVAAIKPDNPVSVQNVQSVNTVKTMLSDKIHSINGFED